MIGAIASCLWKSFTEFLIDSLLIGCPMIFEQRIDAKMIGINDFPTFFSVWPFLLVEGFSL